MPAHRLNGGPVFLILAGRETVVGAGGTAGTEPGPTSPTEPGAGLPGTEVWGLKLSTAGVREK